MMDVSFSNEFCYMSATSFSQEMCFYSAPTSPSGLKLRPVSPFGSRTGPTTPRATTHEDANSNVDEFEFETSRRFNVSVRDLDTETNQKDHENQQEKQRLCGGDSLQTMAFADELFCDGKVLPLMQLPPLKLPPRLHQSGDGSIVSTHSSTLTSPRSPGSVLRLQFSRHSLWNDDFDPFMVALEKVREEKRGKPSARHGLRRTRSLSPFRGFNHKSEKNVKVSKSSQQPESNCCDTAQLVCELEKGSLKQMSGRINGLSEPKGLVFERQVRLVGLSNETTSERTSVSKVEMETKKDEGKRGGFWTRSKKRENIKKFLFGNMGKDYTHHKLEDKMVAQETTPLVRKLDMKSVTSTESTQWDKYPRTGELTKMRLVCHRPLPRLFLCLGYEGGKVK
uniref:Uncharacterized protein n=1 Tax=Cajanus cajan TaxID=3821 RepID=A0A151U1S1_CAJCA|nr:hypothetical protein KK1_005850 [Cajanus cajan]